MSETEIRFCGCDCGGSKEVLVNSTWKYFRGHNLRVNNPMKNPIISMKKGFAHRGKPSWNKGLTKETDERVAKNSTLVKIALNRPEVKAKMIASLKSTLNQPEIKVKQRAVRKGKTYEEIYGDRAEELKAKNSASQKGKPKSVESVMKRSGEKHPNWQGGIANLSYPFEFNDEFKEFVRERYDHICMLCKLTQEQVGHTLNVHHIDYDKDNMDPDNFLPLCDSCHGPTTIRKNRIYWTKVLRSIVEMNKNLMLVVSL